MTPLLQLEAVTGGYGRAQVLFDVDLEVMPGGVTVLLGRNGAGKTTLLSTVMGLVRPWSGRILFDDTAIAGWPPYRIARLGLGYVPEDRRVFPDLTILENLEVGRQPPRAGAPAWTAESVFALFPGLEPLAHRRAARTSGGEQQMLAIARTLMGNPRLLLLDEPSEGLAPVVVDALARAIRKLKAEGLAILLSEQNLRFAGRVADQACIIESGQIRHRAAMAELMQDSAALDRHLAL